MVAIKKHKTIRRYTYEEDANVFVEVLRVSLFFCINFISLYKVYTVYNVENVTLYEEGGMEYDWGALHWRWHMMVI